MYLHLFNESMDINVAVLSVSLNEDVYVQSLFCRPCGKELVLKLNKVMYGLKQSSSEWNMELNKFLKKVLRTTKL